MLNVSKRSSVSVWPGYVDALSALLMVVIFVLLVFAFAQFLLSEIISGQESQLDTLNQQLTELTEVLGLEQKLTEELTADVVLLRTQVKDLTAKKSDMSSRVEELTIRSEVDRETLEEQLLLIASLQEDIASLRQVRRDLEQRVGTLVVSLRSKSAEAGRLRDRSKALGATLAEEEERTLLAQREIEEKNIRIQALAALVGEQKNALEEERQLSASARAELILLNQKLSGLRSQLEEINHALQVAEKTKTAQEAKIKDLGKRLNIELARKVNELERYRSEFFGRLRQVLGNNPYIRIEGDRFMFQAELLFGSGSADLGEEGKQHLSKLAVILRQLSDRIPGDLNWILRIDGHTDRVPITSGRFASNWELSTARALSVVRFLADQGISEKRMVAAGFSKFHPLDRAETTRAYRKNRRIEIKLTSR